MTRYYLVVCKDCWPERNDAPQVFFDNPTREAWIELHQDTGHDKFLRWEEARDD